jgi:hypothetical protein
MAIKFISPLGNQQRRDYEIDLSSSSDASYFTNNPNGAGSAITLDAGYFGMIVGGKLRVANGTQVNPLAVSDVQLTSGVLPNVMLIITQKGDYTMQAIGKAACVTNYGLEFQTDIYTASGIIEGSALSITAGKLCLASASGDMIVAICTAAASGGFITAKLVSPTLNGA